MLPPPKKEKVAASGRHNLTVNITPESLFFQWIGGVGLLPRKNGLMGASYDPNTLTVRLYLFKSGVKQYELVRFIESKRV